MKINARKKILAVQNSNGKMVEALIILGGPKIQIVVEPLSEAIGEPDVSADGIISFKVARADYSASIRALEKYIESLVLRSLSHDHRNPSVDNQPVADGPRKEPDPGDLEVDQGKNDTPVDSRGDGDKPTPRPKRKRKPPIVVAEESDTSLEISIEGGDENVPGPREGDEPTLGED